MNTRQKAKKYKRMNENFLKHFLKPPVKYEAVQHKIDTLRFERFYPGALVMQENSDHLREIIVKDIAYCLASSLDKYIDYNTEFCPHINEYRFCGEIKVINRK